MDRQQFSRRDEAAHLGSLTRPERHPLEFISASNNQPDVWAIDSISSTPGMIG